jgi:hypothetical protein
VKNDKAKIAIREKMDTYMSRAEQIKEALDKRAEAATAAAASAGPKKKAVVAGGSAAGGSSKKEGGAGGGAGGEGDDDSAEEVDPETAKLEAALSGAIVKETPNVKWEDVAGLDQAKALLKEAVILPVKFPQLFTGKRTPWKGILLYGPPGTGQSGRARMTRQATMGTALHHVFSGAPSAHALSEAIALSSRGSTVVKAKRCAILQRWLLLTRCCAVVRFSVPLSPSAALR